jgi:proteasome lid subunit RPN8/RPN11
LHDAFGSVLTMDLPQDVYRAMTRHAHRCLPEEACGLVAFDPGGQITEAFCLTNLDHSPSAFTVDPGEHFQSLDEAERRGWVIGGSFHSHPRSAAAPSRTDVERALEPEWLYLIIGRVTEVPEVRAWRIRSGKATEEPLRVTAPRGTQGVGTCR